MIKELKINITTKIINSNVHLRNSW